MKNLKKIFEEIEHEVISGNSDFDVSDLVFDSKKAKEGSAFFCFIGANSDGHSYIKEAINSGARAIIIQKDIEEISIDAELKAAEYAVIKVKNTRYALAMASAAFYDYPAKRLTTVAITGTKGKTSIATIIRDILVSAGHKVGIIGTVGADVGGEFITTETTTPESLDVEKFFSMMLNNGCDMCVMEVSSQALKLDRVAGIVFDYGIFTNLSPDHIGGPEHKDFEEYVYCKSLLFRQCRKGIFNADDENFKEMIKEATCEIQTYSYINESDLKAGDLRYIRKDDFIGIAFKTEGLTDNEFPVSAPGEFSMYNALAAVSLAIAVGIDTEIIKDALTKVHVKGRMEPVKISSKFTLLIDYAHNAVAMESILKAMRKYEPKRLVSIFGCGGNRSRLRRFEMGEKSGLYADFTIITEDNSRFEKPADIIADIVTGISKTNGKYIIIEDRTLAIKYAIENAEEGDIILLLGKGHEDYQDKNGIKTPFDERVVIKKILEEINWAYE